VQALGDVAVDVQGDPDGGVLDELAELLNVSRATAYESVRNGSVPSIRMGRKILVPTAAVRRMLLLDSGGPEAA
jgi:excisionase family DNA binding protein